MGRKKWFSRKEVAEMFGVSVRAVYDWTNVHGILKGIKLGPASNSPVRYSEEEVERLVEWFRRYGGKGLLRPKRMPPTGKAENELDKRDGREKGV